MMEAIVEAVHDTGLVPAFRLKKEVVNCHHNYVAKEHLCFLFIHPRAPNLISLRSAGTMPV